MKKFSLPLEHFQYGCEALSLFYYALDIFGCGYYLDQFHQCEVMPRKKMKWCLVGKDADPVLIAAREPSFVYSFEGFWASWPLYCMDHTLSGKEIMAM